MKFNTLIQAIVDAQSNTTDISVIAPFDFSAKKENELLFFFKPEIFEDKSPETLENLLSAVFDKFSAFDVEASGAAVLSGTALGNLQIMDRHYGFINKLSRGVSTMITKEEEDRIKTLLEITPDSRLTVLGGHEFLAAFPHKTIAELNALWFSKGSAKVRSGFYAQYHEVEGTSVALVNGFHPAQLAHFTLPAHQIALVLVHSDRNWAELKNDFVGATFPDKARPGSIRNLLYERKDDFGIREVSSFTNCVHLSAGPFEALFEINNFLSDIRHMEFAPEMTLMGRRLTEAGKAELIRFALSNPSAYYEGKTTDLFTMTEEVNTTQAIQRLFEVAKQD